ncbi:hypothetical protein IW148_005615 [Coemansia sp. RSA 1199]|nr:hypothetical protein IW148_005615 [Coemansia sp. RSA 1199]
MVWLHAQCALRGALGRGEDQHGREWAREFRGCGGLDHGEDQDVHVQAHEFLDYGVLDRGEDRDRDGDQGDRE